MILRLKMWFLFCLRFMRSRADEALADEDHSAKDIVIIGQSRTKCHAYFQSIERQPWYDAFNNAFPSYSYFVWTLGVVFLSEQIHSIVFSVCVCCIYLSYWDWYKKKKKIPYGVHTERVPERGRDIYEETVLTLYSHLWRSLRRAIDMHYTLIFTYSSFIFFHFYNKLIFSADTKKMQKNEEEN